MYECSDQPYIDAELEMIGYKGVSECVRTLTGKMQSYSQQAIANCLNKMDVLPPAEYKKQLGCGIKAALRPRHRWVGQL